MGHYDFYIEDNEKKYPKSIVKYRKFKSYGLRQMFHYLREKENIYQIDLTRTNNETQRHAIKCKLREVEAMLVWMVFNLPLTERFIKHNQGRGGKSNF